MSGLVKRKRKIMRNIFCDFNSSLVFTCLQYKSFENTVGKAEITHYEQFLLFPVFSTCMETFLPFSTNLKLLSAKSFSLEESEICRLGKG